MTQRQEQRDDDLYAGAFVRMERQAIEMQTELGLSPSEVFRLFVAIGIGAGLGAGSTFDVADALQEFAKEVESDPMIN